MKTGYDKASLNCKGDSLDKFHTKCFIQSCTVGVLLDVIESTYLQICTTKDFSSKQFVLYFLNHDNNRKKTHLIYNKTIFKRLKQDRK